MTPVEWARKNDVWYLKIDLEIPEIIIREAQTVQTHYLLTQMVMESMMI